MPNIKNLTEDVYKYISSSNFSAYMQFNYHKAELNYGHGSDVHLTDYLNIFSDEYPVYKNGIYFGWYTYKPYDSINIPIVADMKPIPFTAHELLMMFPHLLSVIQE